ncbi:Abi family protein [Citricoccus nitrophenolicus]|uniref:Abi family protein n=1 Tax=Citricoccus nitrophenolicus TaxID=863575 RepID=UPI003608FB66
MNRPRGGAKSDHHSGAKRGCHTHRSKSPTIARYTADSGSLEDVPVWVAVEVLSFGSIAKMVQYLQDDYPARAVASSYSVKWAGFQSTIHSLAVLRNVCAHHAQIWHRKLDIQCPTNRKLRPREYLRVWEPPSIAFQSHLYCR